MQRQRLVIVPPAAESLLAIGTENSFWPAELQNNPAIITQAEMRRNLFTKLDALFRQIPRASMEITEAIDSRKIDPETVAETYNLLADFLDADPCHRRLVLYLPFEMIPDKIWQPSSDKLAASSNRFVSSYMLRWYELLKENDVRANFSDGNILELELSPNGQNMVCKAAHLIPKLVQKRLISIAQVKNLLVDCRSDILKESVIDTLPVLADMSLIYYGQNDGQRIIRRETEENAADWFRELPTDAEFELKKIEMRSALDQSRGIPKLRVAWEKQEKENALVEKYANKIAAMLVEGLLTTKDTCNFLKSKSDKLTCLAIVNGVRKAIEMIAKDNLKKAREIFLAHEDDVQSLWLKDLPEMRDTITSMFSRLTNLGVIERVCLEKLGIHLPKLDSMVSNSKDLIVTEIQDLAPIINSMATNTDISKLIYPVAILFGSRLKGYAKRNADLDVAVFIKPDVPRNKRPEIQRILSRVFSNKKIDGKIVEFWLTEENSKLQIIDFTDADVSLADSTWIHLLFASVWFGKEDAIRELYTKLLPGFIYSTGKKFEDYDARDLWLDEMEREVLQYRLMHKGYKRLFPEEGGIRTEHAKGMDPQSSFWDSGYRRLATKLFITRVFLPQLKEPKQK